MVSFESITPIWLRAAILFIVVVIFQVVMANVPMDKPGKRRLQHALTGYALVQISYILSREVSLILLMIGAGAIYIGQKRYPSEFRKHFGPLLRPSELAGSRLPGAFYFLLGTAITVFLVRDWTIIRYAVMVLSFADPVASWAGTTIQSPKITSGTSLAGSIACFATAWLVGYIMLGSGTDNRTITIGAAVCMIAEGVPYGDDNLNIPIATALVVERMGSSWWSF